MLEGWGRRGRKGKWQNVTECQGGEEQARERDERETRRTVMRGDERRAV